MIKIRKDNVEKLVTRGLYEELFEAMGYEIVNEAKKKNNYNTKTADVADDDKELEPTNTNFKNKDKNKSEE